MKVTGSGYSFAQQVMTRVASSAIEAETPTQPGSRVTVNCIGADCHTLTERTQG